MIRTWITEPARTARRVWPAMLMASTVLGGGTSALAAAAAPAPAAEAQPGTEVGELVVTAEKREENIQDVPMSIQAMDTKTLNRLNINGFADYIKFMPSVSYQTLAPDQTTIYMRGVASGDNANHSGPLPSVGSYLDEQPITTIGGTLDVHIYDIARIEVLPGPQGTFYGASSESGTMRIITNQPTTSGFSAGYDLQGNWVDHGDLGYVAEGFVNIPVTSKIAIRLVAFDELDSGFIDNVAGTRPFATSGDTLTNTREVNNNFNAVQTYGGRLAAKFDINDNWSVTPSIDYQDMRADGIFGYNPAVGFLEVQRFQPDSFHDNWYQAALTVNGKIGNYDLTYSGGYFDRWVHSLSDYTDYSVAYDAAFGSGYFWRDNAGNTLPLPTEEIIGQDQFQKESNELRIVSPATDRFRFVAGLFQERQTHWIIQDYQIQGFGAALDLPGLPGLTSLAVPGWPNTIWLTDQYRTDRDQAAYGEVTYDITPKLSITGGLRIYHYENSLYGFYGYSGAYDYLTGYGPGEGVTVDPVTGVPTFGTKCLPGETFDNAPCVNLNKTVSQTGQTHKLNLSYKFNDEKLVYFTYSTGYRPGGVNRSGDFGPYQADTLANYEVGWKTTWFDHSLTFDGALYDEEWTNFQFSFLGPNSLTIVENAPSARVLGVEASVDWRVNEHLTLSTGDSYNDAKLTQNFCTDANGNPVSNCTGLVIQAPDGQQLPYTPRFKGNVTGRYAFDVDGWNAFFQGSVLYQTLNYAALRTADTALLGTMPAYATVDLSVGASRNNLSLSVFVKNALNAQGQVNRYTPCTVSTCAVSYTGIPAAVYVVPIAPFTLGIKIGQRF